MAFVIFMVSFTLLMRLCISLIFAIVISIPPPFSGGTNSQNSRSVQP